MAGSTDMTEENKSGIRTYCGVSAIFRDWTLTVEVSNSRTGSKSVTVEDIFTS